MRKLYKNETGFGAIEAILILVIVIAIAGVGWYVWKAKKNTDSTYNTVANTSTTNKPIVKPKTTITVDPYAGWKTYNDPSNIFSVKYPDNWTLQLQANSMDPDNPIDSNYAMIIPSNLPSAAVGNTAIDVGADKATLNKTMNDLETSSSANYNPSSTTINGYSSLFQEAKVPSNGGNSYTEDFYGVEHNNITVTFNFREKQIGNGNSPQDGSFDISNDNSEFVLIVKSIKFYN
jgi:hypothetical protein